MTETLTAHNLGGLTVEKVGNRTPYLNLSFYSDSGVGKTVLAGSASVVPEMGKVLCLDFEGGTESLRRTYPNVDVVRLTDISQAQPVYDELYHSKTHGYGTVIVDSITELQTFNMAGIMGEKLEAKPGADPDVPEWEQHNKNLIRMRKFVRAFRDLPMHTIITALSMELQDKRTGLVTILPKFQGSFRVEYPALLDVILYYYTKELRNDDGTYQERILLTRKTEKHVAKDRTGTLPETIIAPTMQKIFDFMKNAPSELAPEKEEEKIVIPTETEPVDNTDENSLDLNV